MKRALMAACQVVDGPRYEGESREGGTGRPAPLLDQITCFAYQGRLLLSVMSVRAKRYRQTTAQGYRPIPLGAVSLRIASPSVPRTLPSSIPHADPPPSRTSLRTRDRYTQVMACSKVHAITLAVP